jgi:hypothetical protein
MLSRPEYRSEVTLFLSDLKKQDISLEEKQKKARATWWAPILFSEFSLRARQAQVTQKPYVYQVGEKE